MTKGQVALVSIIGFVALVAIVFLILAPCLGYSNIIEMFKAWAGNDVTSTPVENVEEVVETTKLALKTILRI